MSIGHMQIGKLSVNRLILGGNPFSGFSHFGRQKDQEMRRYYTTARIKETLRRAESLGIDTFIGRADNHISRVLLEYWDEGGAIQWIAQTTPELATIGRGVDRAVNGGAKACFIHGGQMDFLFAHNRLGDVPPAVERIKGAGLYAGVAGHNPKVFEWAEENLDLDFYMTCYYHSADRDQHAEHLPGMDEQFLPAERLVMTRMIQGLSRPAIHYKVMAAGRGDPAEAFSFVAQHLRPQDGVCVGVYTRNKPDMLADNLRLLEEGLASVASRGAIS